MLDGLNITKPVSRPAIDIDDATLSKYFVELVQFLPTDQTIDLWKDIEAYEREGTVANSIETLLNRARIVAEADRIIAKY
ncbi:MAG: hypothetical protein AAFN59_04325 [Pseudomonadota bacterium]